METVLYSRNSFSPLIRFVDCKFGIFVSLRHFYIHACNGKSRIIIVESKDIINSYDIFYNSIGTYVIYAAQNGSLYAMSGDFFPDESACRDGTYQVITPNFHEQILTSSSSSELITINNENKTCFFFESITNFDKKLTCYLINVNNKKFTMELLWIYDYKSECPGDIRLGSTIKSFSIISYSMKERLSLTNRIVGKLVGISDSLFVNLFGNRNNLECQLIVMICFPDGTINWITGCNDAHTKISLNLFWSMQEEIINVHSIGINKLNEEVNCLLVIGKSGSTVIFGLHQFPANFGFQIYCQIDSSDVFEDNLLFSTSDGIFMLNLSDILNKNVNQDKITPKLISTFKIRSFKIDQYNSSKGDIKIYACSFDNKIVKFSLSTTQALNHNATQSMKEPNKIKYILSSIEGLTKQNEEIQKTCDILSRDFTNLCMASHIFQEFKDYENASQDQDLSKIKIISDLDVDIYTEYQCLSTKDGKYNITIHFQFCDTTLKSDSNYSFVAHILPSQFSSSFPRGIFKTAYMQDSTLVSRTIDELVTLKCSLSFMCTLPVNILPLSISTYLCLQFNPINNLKPLMIPLKNFEAGILKFVLSDHKLQGIKSSKSLNADEIIIIKHSKNNILCLPSMVSSVVPYNKWESVKVVLNNPENDIVEIWKDLFKGNKSIHETLFTSNELNLEINGNVPLKLEIIGGCPTFLIISSTSLLVLSLLHHEVVLIMYKVANLFLTKNTVFPILEAKDCEAVNNKLMRLDSFEENLDSTFESADLDMFHCYKIHREC